MALTVLRFSNKISLDFKLHVFYGFFLRFFLIMYGLHHDATQVVKFTDIDYYVFTDAASHVSKGGSPFDRPTYRYTPFLAWLLLPNIYYSHVYGKILFAILDCIAAKLIYEILRLDGYSVIVASKFSLQLWLYNPLVLIMSARGSSDCLMAVLVLLMVYFMKLRLPVLTGFFLGVAIHFKIYPVIYMLPIYLSFTRNFRSATVFERYWVNRPKIKFLWGSICGFLVLTGLAYMMYGKQYIEESYLYHFQRVDTRHNFSVYFYILYLCEVCHPLVIKLCTFVPQFLMVCVFGWKFAGPSDLNFGLFAQTFVFVAYNKVVTSQYFIWYLLLLPLIAPKLDMSTTKFVSLSFCWLVAQGSWLLPAYLLEFCGMDTYFAIWLEGIAFLCCNVSIMIALIRSYGNKKD